MDTTRKHWFVLIDNLLTDVIFGTPFMKRFGITMDFTSEYITLNNFTLTNKNLAELMLLKPPPKFPKTHIQSPQDCHTWDFHCSTQKTFDPHVALCALCALEDTLAKDPITGPPVTQKYTPDIQALADRLNLSLSILSHDEQLRILKLVQEFKDLWDHHPNEQILHTESAEMTIDLVNDKPIRSNYRTQNPA
jgi:hypothetical protein